MKLRNIFVICRDNYSAIEGIKSNSISLNGRSGARVFGWKNAIQALENLKEISALKITVDSLVDAVPVFYRMKENFDVSNDEWTLIYNAKAALLSKMKNIIELYETTGQSTEPHIGVDIKLPETKDFSEFAKCITDLEIVLTKCPFLNCEEEKLEFDNVDIGTTWVTFFIASVAATTATVGVSVLLNNMAALVDKCIVIRSHLLTYEKQKEELENDKRKEEEKAIIATYIKERYEKCVEFELKELESLSNHTLADPEEKSRALLTIDKMGELIDKGLQIYSTLDSPREAKAMFEPIEMKYIEVEKMLNLITEKKD